MRVYDQTIEEVVDSLSPLAVDWMDETAASAIARLTAIPKQAAYTREDIAQLLDDDFEEGILCARLFLALSKDSMEAELRSSLGQGIGVKRYKTDRKAYLDTLEALDLPAKMADAINYEAVWSDILVERLRSGRGSAIQGQKRGRGLEDFVEALVKDIFGEGAYETRCTFTGVGGKTAKCDVAIPNRAKPRIIIEVKGYGATGSKMSDVTGDLDAIIAAKRHDSHLLVVTDGMTWKARLSDLKKIVQRQNDGKIARIYTTKMREKFAEELKSLKQSCGL